MPPSRTHRVKADSVIAKLEFTTVPIPVRAARKQARPSPSIDGTATAKEPKTPTVWNHHCPNCDNQFVGRYRIIYCSLRCHDEAKAVRYARHKAIEYPDGPPQDILDAMHDKIAHALSGGYDAAARHLTKEVRIFVKVRDENLCQLCGAVGTEIDHIDGDSSELSNLQLLCDPCHNKKSRSHYKPITEPEILARAHFLDFRITSDEVVYPSDVPSWPWRAWLREHNAIVST